jgi:hypothetical protein
MAAAAAKEALLKGTNHKSLGSVTGTPATKYINFLFARNQTHSTNYTSHWSKYYVQFHLLIPFSNWCIRWTKKHIDLV